MRTNATQLPSYDELRQILSAEAKRDIVPDKERLHYTDFTSIKNLLNSFDLSTSFFTDNINFDGWKDSELFEETSNVFEALTHKILESKDDQSKQELFNYMYDYLSEQDVPGKSDIIFVFGAKTTYRIEKAVNLYHQGYAPFILISGKGPYYNQGETLSLSEAETLAKFALEHGVPKESLILEKESITVPDNVKCSLNLLEKDNISHDKIILINSPFSQRRGWAHFQKMSDMDTTLFRVNTDKVSEQFSRDGWYKDEAGVKIIVKEFFGLRVSEMLNTS